MRWNRPGSPRSSRTRLRLSKLGQAPRSRGRSIPGVRAGVRSHRRSQFRAAAGDHHRYPGRGGIHGRSCAEFEAAEPAIVETVAVDAAIQETASEIAVSTVAETGVVAGDVIVPAPEAVVECGEVVVDVSHATSTMVEAVVVAEEVIVPAPERRRRRRAGNRSRARGGGGICRDDSRGHRGGRGCDRVCTLQVMETAEAAAVAEEVMVFVPAGAGGGG